MTDFGLSVRAEAAADACFQQLAGTAGESDEFVTWTMLDSRKDGAVEVKHAVCGLYNGMAGIGIFLGYHAHLRGGIRERGLAEKAANTLLAMSETEQFRPNERGAYAGLAGVAYSLAHLGHVLERSDLSEAACSCGFDACDLALQTDCWDIAEGSAGVLAALHAVNASRGGDATLRREIESLVAHVIAGARREGQAVYWTTPALHEDAGLPGFAHGVAGIAWSLVNSASMTPMPLDDILRGAAQYVHGLYRVEMDNWLVSVLPHRAALSWCHGPPGILASLARLARAFPHLGLDGDIARALSRLHLRPVGVDHCLCHGDMGAIAALSYADRNGVSGAERLARTTAAQMLAGCPQSEWRGGLPVNYCGPGLMTGIAGIGLQALALAYPGRVPNVLTFDPVPAPPEQQSSGPSRASS